MEEYQSFIERLRRLDKEIIALVYYGELFLKVEINQPHTYFRLIIRSKEDQYPSSYYVPVNNSGMERLFELYRVARDKREFDRYYKKDRIRLRRDLREVMNNLIEHGYSVDCTNGYWTTPPMSYRLVAKKYNRTCFVVENNVFFNRHIVRRSLMSREDITNFEEEEFDIGIVEEMLEINRENQIKQLITELYNLEINLPATRIFIGSFEFVLAAKNYRIYATITDHMAYSQKCYRCSILRNSDGIEKFKKVLSMSIEELDKYCKETIEGIKDRLVGILKELENSGYIIEVNKNSLIEDIVVLDKDKNLYLKIIPNIITREVSMVGFNKIIYFREGDTIELKKLI